MWTCAKPYLAHLAGSVAHVSIAARAVKLCKTYGSGTATVVALDHVDFEVQAGEFTAIMGPSGSGKSTLMHLLAALDSPTSGQVFIGDQDVGTLKDTPLTELRRDRIGFVFQSFNLVPTLTARENIVLPLSIAGGKPDRVWFDQIVDLLGLRDRLTHKPSELSGGQQQRVACARALMNRPEIVFADEPTGNLDSGSAAEVLSFLRRSVDDFHQTIVMVTHDALAASYADRAVFLHDGRIIDECRGASQEEILQLMSRLYPRQAPPEHGKPLGDETNPFAPRTDPGNARHFAATSPARAMLDDRDTAEQPRLAVGEPAVFRDGAPQPAPNGIAHPETEAEISAPRRAITE